MSASKYLVDLRQTFDLSSILQSSLNKTVKFQIDNNLCLKLVLKPIKGALLFSGTILHRNGLEVKLSPKSWRLISHYSQLQISNLIFLYDFNRLTVNVSSKILFTPHLTPTNKFIASHCQNILKRVKSFTSTLCRYQILKFSNKFSFSQFFQEVKLKRQLCLQLRHGIQTTQILSTQDSFKQCEMIDEKKESRPSSNIQQWSITQCRVEDLKQIPQNLQGGPKNIKFNFDNNKSSSIVSGGFFEIQKLLCCLQKKLYKSDQSNHKSVGQNCDLSNQNIADEKKKNQKQYDILVRKTLKKRKSEHESNRLKISKELIIVQQIKKKYHLLKYFKNQEKLCPEITLQSSKILRMTRDTNKSLSMLNEDANVEKEKKQQNKSFQYEKEIYMEFHPHTLKDFIAKSNRSLDETLDACLQLLQATVHLHQSGVIHRDIKPENVLIDYETHKNRQLIKMIDFAQSAIHTEAIINPELQKEAKQAILQIFEKYDSRLHGATLPYSPPECQNQRSKRNSPGVNSYKIDSWSMGMILPQIYHGKRLVNFPRPYADDIINLIKDSGFESHLSRVNKKGFEMGQALIAYIGMKNTLYNQSLRLDVMRSYRALNILNKKMQKWQKRIRSKSQQCRFEQGRA